MRKKLAALLTIPLFLARCNVQNNPQILTYETDVTNEAETDETQETAPEAESGTLLLITVTPDKRNTPAPTTA